MRLPNLELTRSTGASHSGDQPRNIKVPQLNIKKQTDLYRSPVPNKIVTDNEIK
jgi:hypothetical protein